MGLVDEEFGQAGSRKLAKVGPKADLAIAGEPTGLKLITAHKGSLWLQLKTKGVAAHGATPMNGKNAIESMSPILQTLFQDYPKLLNERTHPLLGSPTLNIGKILGGTQPNIVADHCTIDLDRRTIPGEDEESVKHELKNLFQQQKLPVPEFVLSRSVPCPPLNTNPNLPFIQSLLRATQKRKKPTEFLILLMHPQLRWEERQQWYLGQEILLKPMQKMSGFNSKNLILQEQSY